MYTSFSVALAASIAHKYAQGPWQSRMNQGMHMIRHDDKAGAIAGLIL
jgi:hypothetical protein